MKGKLLVLEGLDASGKHTQAALLARGLQRAGKRVQSIGFPTYGTPWGKLVKKYLQGKFGGKDALPPQIPAMLYAADRRQHAKKIRGWLAHGEWVVCDRYTQSNLYQAAKINAESGRKAFISWLKKLEREMPQANTVMFLDVPLASSRKLLVKRGRRQDVHEKDAAYLARVRRLYLQEAKANRWKVVKCVRQGRLRGKQDIAGEILGVALRG